jgi:hypothetical protein
VGLYIHSPIRLHGVVRRDNIYPSSILLYIPSSHLVFLFTSTGSDNHVITVISDKCSDLAGFGQKVMKEDTTAATEREASSTIIPTGWLTW